MKRIWALVLSMVLTLGFSIALSEVDNLPIDEVDSLTTYDMYDVVELDGQYELSISDISITDSYGSYQADSRNQYLTLTLHVLNTSMDELQIGNLLSGKLQYKGHDFNSIKVMESKPSVDLPIGEWTVYESILGEKVHQFDVSIRSIDEFGNMDMQWGTYKPPHPVWHASQSYFDLDNTQSFVYLKGYIAGGGSKYRSIGIRKGGNSSSEIGDALSVLEEEDYDLVFRVPNIVVEHLWESVVTINAGENTFVFNIQ